MAPHSILLRPRHGAASLISVLSASSSSAAGTSSSLTQAAPDLKRCNYCPREFSSSLELHQHIVDTPKCKAAQHAVLVRATKRQTAECRQRTVTESNGAAQPDAPNTADLHASTGKRKATEQTTPDDDNMPASSGNSSLLSSSKRRKVAVGTIPGEDMPASSGTSNPASSSKRWKVTLETIPDEEATPAPTEHPTRPIPNPPAPPPNGTSSNKPLQHFF